MGSEQLRAASIVLVLAILATFPQRLFSQDDSRLKVPDKQELVASKEVVRELFEGEYRAARTEKERSALARKIVQNAIDTVDDPAGRYALLQLARDIALAAADSETASLAVDTMAKFFQIDDLRMKSALLAELARKPLEREDGKQLVVSARELSRRAAAADRYDLAKPLIDLALKRAKKLRDAALVREIVDESRRLEQTEKQFQEVRLALDILETDPTDADANFIVGKFRCFVKGDWELGLPLLALGSDEQLKGLAIEELKSSRTPAESIAIADRWWRLAESSSDTSSLQQKRRAATHYRAAVSHVSGLPKIKIDKRLAEIARLDKAPATGSSTQWAGEGWRPIGADGRLMQCYTLGPFPSSAVNDRTVLEFLSRGNFSKEFQGMKLTPAATSSSKSYQFNGPDKSQRDHVMYFVFGVTSQKDQGVNLRATTFTRWEHSRVNAFLDFRPVTSNGNVPLGKGKHTVVVKQHHLKSDRAGRSWITLEMRGENLQQAVLLR